MLHRMDAWVASEFQRMDWDGAAALGRRALVWFGLAGTVFLLCKAQLPPTMAPFGMAFLAAALAARKSGAALLVGCVLAAMGGSPAEFNLRLPAGAAIVLGGGIAWDALAPALRRALGQGLWLRIRKRETGGANRMPRRQARSPNSRDGAACSALAGLGVLVPGLIGLGEVLWPRAAEAVAASVAAVAAAPFFRAALEARPGRRWLNAEERAGVFLLWGFMLVGLGRLSLPVALCVGGALAQLLTGAGALAGVCTGAALLIAGADPRMMALTAVGGATVQLCAGMSRPTRAAVVAQHRGLVAAGGPHARTLGEGVEPSVRKSPRPLRSQAPCVAPSAGLRSAAQGPGRGLWRVGGGLPRACLAAGRA